MIRTSAIRPAAVTTLASAVLLTAVGGLLFASGADAKSKPAPKPSAVRAMLATNLSEAGGSSIAVRLAKPAPATVQLLVQTRVTGGIDAASAPDDFVARSQWVTIKKGAKFGSFTPKIVDDAIDERDERLQIRILKASKWAKLPAAKYRAAFATIRDNDAAPATPSPNDPGPSKPTPKADPSVQPTPPAYVPSITVSDAAAQIIEGDAQNATARFKVTLDAPTTVPVDAPYSIADGSATAGVDFTAVAPGTLTFAPGVTELVIDVPVLDDPIDEDTEKAQLTLGAPVGATLATGTGELTIFDDETAPSMAIKNVDRDEGTIQNTIFEFEVGLSHPSSKVVSMSTYTLGLNATGGVNCFIPGVDYVSIGSKQITFQPGETVKTMQVKVCGDNTVEQDEYFALPLTDLVNATTSNPQGMGQIENDDQ